ncbi:uncharacterized protein LOC125537456 [Triticum urartu]|uniref:uncharacterized protein LOC125537456 n=1 Tax=Triticum urartu TaxID=4572 RepID=UPI002043C02A|nr:uncharacterized protein LOC125537456 [Triticum urartu]
MVAITADYPGLLPASHGRPSGRRAGPIATRHQQAPKPGRQKRKAVRTETPALRSLVPSSQKPSPLLDPPRDPLHSNQPPIPSSSISATNQPSLSSASYRPREEDILLEPELLFPSRSHPAASNLAGLQLQVAAALVNPRRSSVGAPLAGSGPETGGSIHPRLSPMPFAASHTPLLVPEHERLTGRLPQQSRIKSRDVVLVLAASPLSSSAQGDEPLSNSSNDIAPRSDCRRRHGLLRLDAMAART